MSYSQKVRPAYSRVSAVKPSSVARSIQRLASFEEAGKSPLPLGSKQDQYGYLGFTYPGGKGKTGAS